MFLALSLHAFVCSIALPYIWEKETTAFQLNHTYLQGAVYFGSNEIAPLLSCFSASTRFHTATFALRGMWVRV